LLVDHEQKCILEQLVRTQLTCPSTIVINTKEFLTYRLTHQDHLNGCMIQ